MMFRMKEVRHVKLGTMCAANVRGLYDEDGVNVVSLWGPYMTTSSTAKTASVPGLTVPSAL